MVRKRYTEEQIIGVLKESEARGQDGGSVPEARHERGQLLQSGSGAL